MKKFGLIFILLCFFSCKKHNTKDIISQKDSPAEEKVVRRDEVHIELNDTTEVFFTNLRMNEFQERPDMIEIGKGSGPQSLTIPTENKMNILGGNPPASFFYNLELDRGDSLKITFEKVKLDDQNEIRIPIFRITNSDKKWSEINFASLLYKKNVNTNAIDIDTTQSFFITNLNSKKIYQNALALLNDLHSDNKISDEFYLNEKDNHKYEFARRKLREEEIIENGTNNNMIIGDQKIFLDNEDQIQNTSYILLLREIIEKVYFNGNEREPSSKKFDYVLTNETFLNDELKIAVLDSYLKSVFFLEKKLFPVYLEKFNEVNTKTENEIKWREVLTNLEQDQIRLNTSNRNIAVLMNLVNDDQLTFEEILENQKGKVVLVDFWASWCAPCLKEMPHMTKLKSLFEKDQFQVIEISIDKDYAAWKRASSILRIDKEEHSYIITKWDESNLHKNYSIKTIPRYLLFNKEGKIINEDAPRPSNEDLEKLIRASIGSVN